MQEIGLRSLGQEDSGGGNGNPLQYSCLENSMDRGAWQATVHEVAKSWTHLSTHIHKFLQVMDLFYILSFVAFSSTLPSLVGTNFNKQNLLS